MKYSISVILIVSLLISCSKNEQTIAPSQVTQSYGLGKILTKSVSNNRDYSWYLDQGNTGTYSNVNCGPTSVTMSIKWVNKAFALTPQDARAKYRSQGGWWYTDDIINYLNDNSVNNSTIGLTNISLLKDELDGGNIAILCLDMYYVDETYNTSYHVDKFYDASYKGWGHFIVIKGYKVVDGNVFYEVYDPNSFGATYTDQSLKGKDRYYRSINLDAATNNWWDYAIIVPPSSTTGSRIKSISNIVDPEQIPHQSGR
ncbi:MAG: hypothetical protein QM734_06370 [Cyclobacteriaceae bacterium]